MDLGHLDPPRAWSVGGGNLAGSNRGPHAPPKSSNLTLGVDLV